jgi:translation initiation factor IF-2
VVEAKLDKGRGPLATILVQRGTLKVGDVIVVGAASGKVRAMIDDHGRQVKELRPPSRSRCSASAPCRRPATS